MQSPLTPQRGRIESNPREYTHMESPACDELVVMPLGSRCAPAVHRSSVEIRTHESGYSDAHGMRVESRTESAAKSPKTVRKSTLIHRPCISHPSLVSKPRDKEKDER